MVNAAAAAAVTAPLLLGQCLPCPLPLPLSLSLGLSLSLSLSRPLPLPLPLPLPNGDRKASFQCFSEKHRPDAPDSFLESIVSMLFFLQKVSFQSIVLNAFLKRIVSENHRFVQCFPPGAVPRRRAEAGHVSRGRRVAL